MSNKLDDFIEQYQQQVSPLLTEYVAEWESPIYQHPEDDDWVHWRAQKQQPELNFSDLEAALELTFHPSIKDFYGRWFAGDLRVIHQQAEASHAVSLLQVQGPEDGRRLLENITGHILMKRQLKQRATIFIGMAEETDDLLISIDNESGQVGLEWLGKDHHQVLANSLDEFLSQCTPNSGENGD